MVALLGEKAASGRSAPAPPEIEPVGGDLRASESVPRPVDRPFRARPRAMTADPRTVGEPAGEVLGDLPPSHSCDATVRASRTAPTGRGSRGTGVPARAL